MDTAASSSKSFNAADSIYKKLREDGSTNPSNLNQSDLDQVTEFIKSTFPQANRVQKELQDQALKRTFVFGRAEKVIKPDKSLGSRNQKRKSILNRRQRLKLQQIAPKKIEYEQFVSLNCLWNSYIQQLCGSDTVADIQAKLNRVDLHGALVTVVQSNCKAYENLVGIIIKETKNTLVIVTKLNFTKTIPKQETIFEINLENPNGTMRIAGNSFLSRPAERSSKKIKSFMNFVGMKAYKSKLKYDRIETHIQDH